jgi:putative transposase
MSANQALFPIATMARVLGVSTAGYYAWRSRPPSARCIADDALLKQVRTIHAVSRGTYGAPRVHAELRAEGRAVGTKRIARLMRVAGIIGVSRRRDVVTTQQDPDARPAPDPRLRRGRLWWTATSLPIALTSSGSPTSRISRQQPGSCISLSCSMRSVDGSSAGRWKRTCGPSSFWRHLRWRSASASRSTSSTTATGAASIPRGVRRPLSAGWRPPVNGICRRCRRQCHVRELLRHTRMRTPGTP